MKSFAPTHEDPAVVAPPAGRSSPPSAWKGRRPRRRRQPPLYLGMKTDLERCIRAGQWPAGMRVPSESELIARYRVSSTTARRCLNDLENDGLLRRVRGSGTFVSDLAPVMRQRQIAVIVRDLCSLAHPFLAQILTGLEKATDGQAVNLRIHRAPAGDDPLTLGRALVLLLDHDAAEAAFVLSNFPLRAIQPLLDRGVRCLGVNTCYQDDRLPHLALDAARMLETSLRNILQRGHRRILFLLFEPPMAAEGVLNSTSHIEPLYRRLRADYSDLPPEPCLRYLSYADTEAQLPGTLAAALKGPQPPTAVFCVDELVGLQTVAALERRGYAVPRRMSVVGGSKLLPISPLACTECDITRMAFEAGQAMLAWLRGRRPANRLLPPGRFLARGTLTAPRPGR